VRDLGSSEAAYNDRPCAAGYAARGDLGGRWFNGFGFTCGDVGKLVQFSLSFQRESCDLDLVKSRHFEGVRGVVGSEQSKSLLFLLVPTDATALPPTPPFCRLSRADGESHGDPERLCSFLGEGGGLHLENAFFSVQARESSRT